MGRAYDYIIIEDNKNYFKCAGCKKVKVWYNFPVTRKMEFLKKAKICFKCLDRRMIYKIKRLMKEADDRNMNSLRGKLFDTMDGLQAKTITVQEAKAICEVAQVIINTAKVEIDFIKAVGSKKGSEFIQIEAE